MDPLKRSVRQPLCGERRREGLVRDAAGARVDQRHELLDIGMTITPEARTMPPPRRHKAAVSASGTGHRALGTLTPVLSRWERRRDQASSGETECDRAWERISRQSTVTTMMMTRRRTMIIVVTETVTDDAPPVSA